MVWLETQGWTSCLQLVEQRKMMAGQGDKGTVGDAAFGTKTALSGLILNMKPSPWTCNILWSFGRPCYVQYWPKLAVGSTGSLNGSYPSSLGYLRLPALMGTKGQHGKSKYVDSHGQLRTYLAHQIFSKEFKFFCGMDYASSWKHAGNLPLYSYLDSVTFLLRDVDAVFWFLDR